MFVIPVVIPQVQFTKTHMGLVLFVLQLKPTDFRSGIWFGYHNANRHQLELIAFQL